MLAKVIRREFKFAVPVETKKIVKQETLGEDGVTREIEEEVVETTVEERVMSKTMIQGGFDPRSDVEGAAVAEAIQQFGPKAALMAVRDYTQTVDVQLPE